MEKSTHTWKFSLNSVKFVDNIITVKCLPNLVLPDRYLTWHQKKSGDWSLSEAISAHTLNQYTYVCTTTVYKVMLTRKIFHRILQKHNDVFETPSHFVTS